MLNYASQRSQIQLQPLYSMAADTQAKHTHTVVRHCPPPGIHTHTHAHARLCESSKNYIQHLLFLQRRSWVKASVLCCGVWVIVFRQPILWQTKQTAYGAAEKLNLFFFFLHPGRGQHQQIYLIQFVTTYSSWPQQYLARCYLLGRITQISNKPSCLSFLATSFNQNLQEHQTNILQWLHYHVVN